MYDHYETVIFSETLGSNSTRRALKRLRNELAERIFHKLLIFLVPSKENEELYGFFILDGSTEDLIVTLPGFRAAREGECGAGHQAAQALLLIYGVTSVALPPEEGSIYSEGTAGCHVARAAVMEIAGKSGFVRPSDNWPQYLEKRR